MDSWGTNNLSVRDDLVTGSGKTNTFSRAPETAIPTTSHSINH